MNGKITSNKVIRAYTIEANDGITDEVKAAIAKIKGDEYGDFIFIQLDAEDEVFSDRDGEDNIYFFVFKNKNGEWKKSYEGIAYPEAVGSML